MLDLSDEPPMPTTLWMIEDEFIHWNEELLRGEWVDGEVQITPLPDLLHVETQQRLMFVLSSYVESKDLGTVWDPQSAVRLPELRRCRVPDVIFLANERQSLLTATHIDGAPDLIMEVISPESSERDWKTKYGEYEAAGVREYWIIDPVQQILAAYHLNSLRYRAISAQGGRIASQVISGFFIETAWLWQTPPLRLLDIMRELKVLG